ncbi:MAG: HAMP domain-containing sensor histidine kinase [Bacteroidales bacterium]
MNRQLKPASRLTIVFILAIVLSGSILTYFSINNISNLKELTEKRILEEERELSSRFSAALQAEIKAITADFAQETDRPGTIRELLIETAADREYIIQPFILDQDGRFIFPNFAGITEILPEPEFSDRYLTAFRQGEEAEFAQQDLSDAGTFYRTALLSASSASDSAMVLNALGRIAVKAGEFEEALTRYSKIVTDYYLLLDDNGFPYAYYALPQLLKLTNGEDAENMVQTISFCLEKMEEGAIPLSDYSEELLIILTEWMKENTLSDTVKTSRIDQSINSLNARIYFVNEYGDELAGLLKNENPETYYSAGNDFRIINAYSGSNREFFLINTVMKHPAGFLFDRQRLFDMIAEAGLQDGLEFDYIIEFPGGYVSRTEGQRLVHSSQLSPWFPGQILRIGPEDEDLVSDLIRRRSWIYGIASMLLLVAMFLGVALILRDIAREKHLASLRSDFISNVTHELKTPLTSIRMYAESLMMGRIRSDPGQKNYLSVVINESERLKRMINNILEFSKMEKARQEYHPVETSLPDILHSAINDMNYWLEEKKFSMVTEIETDIRVKVDPEKFHQVYANLLSNAIKYSAGPGRIYVRLYKNSDAVISEVEDEGIGIPEDQLTKIFEEFYRVERQDHGEITGTGLGLTVVKEIVKAHGGKIKVESRVGKGSKFSVILFPSRT